MQEDAGQHVLASRHARVQGLDALGYSEHIDYDLVESTNPAFQKAIVRANVFRDHRQVSMQPPPMRGSTCHQCPLDMRIGHNAADLTPCS